MMLPISTMTVRRAGFDFAAGVTMAIGVLLGVGLMLNFLLMALGYQLDATDAGTWDRSGVRLRTDHGTGCQYLETTGGGLTPRLSKAGVQICDGAPA